MRSDLKKIMTTQLLFLVITHLFSYLFFVFMVDIADFNAKKEKKYPGIDLKEFR